MIMSHVRPAAELSIPNYRSHQSWERSPSSSAIAWERLGTAPKEKKFGSWNPGRKIDRHVSSGPSMFPELGTPTGELVVFLAGTNSEDLSRPFRSVPSVISVIQTFLQQISWKIINEELRYHSRSPERVNPYGLLLLNWFAARGFRLGPARPCNVASTVRIVDSEAMRNGAPVWIQILPKVTNIPAHHTGWVLQDSVQLPSRWLNSMVYGR